jgi:MFS family permease
MNRLGRRASFSLLVLANVLLMAAASAPSPIYPLYLQRWGFSVTVLTVVFAVYVAGLVGALLTVGSLSDHVGRRPVLVASLAFASPAVFVSGSVIAGLGVGLTFNGTLRGIGQATPAKSRSEVFSAAYVVSYAALSLPSLAAGLVAPS